MRPSCSIFFQPFRLIDLLVRAMVTPDTGDAAQLNEAAHVVGEVLHPDVGLGARDADRAHQRAAYVDPLWLGPDGPKRPVIRQLFGERGARAASWRALRPNPQVAYCCAAL